MNVTGGNLAGQSGASPPFGPPLFASAVPYLTGNSDNQLQGLDPTQATTITFNNDTAVAGANESDIFVSIIRTSDFANVFSANFLPNTTTSVSLAANTLAAGTSDNLDIDIDFSSRRRRADRDRLHQGCAALRARAGQPVADRHRPGLGSAVRRGPIGQASGGRGLRYSATPGMTPQGWRAGVRCP